MKWLIALLVLSAAFAPDLTTLVETDVGYVSLSGMKKTGQVFELNGTAHTLKLKVTKAFTVKNYSVKITPRNIERIATDMGIPLSDAPNAEIPVGVYEQSFDLPDMVCGNYKVTADAYYDVNGTLTHFEDKLQMKVPCKSFKSRVISGLVSILPYGLLKIIAGWAGLQL